MDSEKAIVNSLIDSAAIVLLGAAFAHATPLGCKKGTKAEPAKVQFSTR